MYKKTIKLFLMDGEIDGRIKCDISNSNIVAYKIPKNKLKDCKENIEIGYSGVYILFGEKDGEICAYIGESENVYKRLVQHLSDKDFWNECLVFIRNDNSFNKGNIRFLEDSLFKLAKEAKRYIIDTKNTTESPLTESEICEMEEVIDVMKIIASALGYKIFNKIKTEKEITSDNLLYINSIGLKAVGAVTNDGFVVFKGSESSKEFKTASSQHLRNKWYELRNMNIVNKNNVFTKDMLFLSPSTAAAMVLGRNSNGLTEWKDKNGKTLKEIMNENI